MANVGAVVNGIRNIMRQDRGISGDAQRLEQLGWMLFLKIMDDKDQELEVIKDNYVSVIPEKFQWRNWATNSEGITGDELINFIDSTELSNKGLFLSLREIKSTTNPKRALIVKEVFDGTNNYMKSGYEMRKVINKLNEIDFTKSEDKHVFGNIYESILQELRDAGNKGEYYTPRAVTQLMTMMTDPKLGEKVLDPAAGTGGFLSAAIDHVRDTYVKTVDDEALLQNSITGWELKPVAYVLGLTNLVLHEIDVPDYHYIDSLKKEYNSIGKKDQVDVILANPPFGASIADGVETNFPSTYRCKESADLFVILMIQLLKPNGRCAIVLPDGSITGDGIKFRIREKLLIDCNLHTIIRLPQSTFFPANVNTNLLFFEKGTPTKEIWYYEHKLPVGQKSYSKLKQIKFEEFEPIINWWNNRTENENSWKININDLKDLDLDVKNPFKPIIETIDINSINNKFQSAKNNFISIFKDISDRLLANKSSILDDLIISENSLFRNLETINHLRNIIVKEAVRGNLTAKWRLENNDLIQGPNSAKGLLKQIEKEKEKLIVQKVIKKEKAIKNVSEDLLYLKSPKEWEYINIQNLYYTIGNRFHQVQSKEYLPEGKYPIIDQGKKKIVGYTNDKNKILKIPYPVIVFGDHTKNIKFIDFDFVIGADGTKILVPFEPMHSKYFFYAILSLDLTDRGYARHFKILKSRNISVPPLLEQIEIVETVDYLLNLCDTLEAVILEFESNSNLLLQSILVDEFK